MEQVADNNLILVSITKMKDNLETSGWMWDIHKSVLKNTGDEIPAIFSETHLNVRYSMYIKARESHDMNKTIGLGIKYHGVELCKCVIPCVPNKAIYSDNEGN